MLPRLTRRDALDAGLIALAVAAGFLLWPRLPPEMAVHFSPAGDPGTYVPRTAGVLLLPGIMLATLAVLRGAARVDPPEDPRVFGVVSSGTMVLLAAVHLAVLAWNAGYDVPLEAVVPGALLWAVGVVAYALVRERSGTGV